jgi:hypothetical protein
MRPAPFQPKWSRARRGWALVVSFQLVTYVAVGTPPVRAEQTRFAVVDLNPGPHNEKLVSSIEREVARLRPGARTVEDPIIRRLLATGQGPADAAMRLFKEAESLREADDCQGAVQKARQAETMILAALSLDEERDPLKALYALLVVCEHRLDREAEARTAAARLRALISLPPSDFPADLWERYVANAEPGPATTELQVDSDPPNAQVSINFRGEGVTPRTLKVAPGLVYVELQKDGYKKAFRAVEVKDRPARTVLRLIEKTHDRVEQAEAQVRALRKSEVSQRVLALSRLAQLARVESLVLFDAADGKVKLWFFDAERGAVTGAPIESPFDPDTGRVAALAKRTAPTQVKAAPPPAKPTGDGPAARPAGGPPTAPKVQEHDSLPEAKAQQQAVASRPRRKKPPTPWWSWLIAGAVGGAFFVFVYADRPQTADTIGVHARWVPPQ